jgi:hypothetical protein
MASVLRLGKITTSARRYLKQLSAEPWPPENKMGPLDPKHKALPKLRRMVNQQ